MVWWRFGVVGCGLHRSNNSRHTLEYAQSRCSLLFCQKQSKMACLDDEPQDFWYILEELANQKDQHGCKFVDDLVYNWQSLVDWGIGLGNDGGGCLGMEIPRQRCTS